MTDNVRLDSREPLQTIIIHSLLFTIHYSFFPLVTASIPLRATKEFKGLRPLA